MASPNKTTTDDAHSPQAAAQQKPGSSMTDKFGGIVNVIHGTEEVIRGHALESGDFGSHGGHGNAREIIAAGRDKVERGLDRIEGIATSATGHDQRGVGDGTGAAPGRDSNTPQATAASRADPTSERDRGDAADTGVQPNTDVRQQGNGITPSDPSGTQV